MTAQRLRPQVILRCTTHMIDMALPSGQPLICGVAALTWLNEHHLMVERTKERCDALHAVDIATINGPLVFLRRYTVNRLHPTWQLSGPHLGELTGNWRDTSLLFAGAVLAYVYHRYMLELDDE